MKIVPTELEGVQIIEPGVFADERGFFMESFHIVMLGGGCIAILGMIIAFLRGPERV